MQTHLMAAVVAALLTASMDAASAADAVVISNANIRAAADSHSRVIGRLSKGTRIDVEKCDRGWCQLAGRKRGFVSASLLNTAPVKQPAQAPRPLKGKQQPVGPSRLR